MTSAVAIAVLAAGGWLLLHDSAWNNYLTPLFWPFLFAAGLMVRFSTTPMAADPRPWRGLVLRLSAAAAGAAAVAAWLAARNPINDIHPRDIAALGALAAMLVVVSGLAAEVGGRLSPGTWIKSACCLAASMLMLALIPRLLVLIHCAGRCG